MEKLTIIKTLTDLAKLEQYLAEKTYVAFDTETTGVTKEDKIIGFSVASEVEEGFYVILGAWNPTEAKLDWLETLEGAQAFMEFLLSKQLIMQNAVFDCSMVENNFQVNLMPSVHTDTMILGHILDENRSNGLKELGVALFGEDARKEQEEMKASVQKNGGVLTKEKYELYKADAELMARYGAKDAILTIKIFYTLVPMLFEEGLDQFFYEDESMPLLRGPTYELNTTGLKVDPEKLSLLRKKLEADCMEAEAFIHKEIQPLIKDEYDGKTKKTTFNLNSNYQLSWLLFHRLGNRFYNLTKQGRELCKALDLKLPYSNRDKNEFIRVVTKNKDRIWRAAGEDESTGKFYKTPAKIGNYWNYLVCGKETLGKLAPKYKWVEVFLEYKKNDKLLTTYVDPIQKRMKYNIIRPSFLQIGTSSGRYSSKLPNFQNLPRDDKRVKSCIIARTGKVFVGADYSQLEPRVFASFSGDERLLNCFKNGDDFYSVIGVEVFEKYECSLKKNDANSFAKLYPKLRDISKVVALSSTYGTTAPKMAPTIDKEIDEAQEIIDSYFEKFPSVRQLMLDSHEMAKNDGRVTNLFGRPRRMPEAKQIRQIHGRNAKHEDLPYSARNILNLAINHRIQSTGASIMNRAAIACWRKCRELEAVDPRWKEVKIILQVHDELILEGPEELASEMTQVLKDAMENTTTLPGVDLIAEPKVAKNLADLK